MKKLKKTFLISVLGSSLLLTGCADDKLSKGLLVLGLAGGGAFLGHKLAGPGNRAAGAAVGAIGGGALGLLFGGGLGGGGTR